MSAPLLGPMGYAHMEDGPSSTEPDHCVPYHVNITDQVYAVSLHQRSSDAPRVNLCWPGISIEYVTHNGEIVTHNGEPVYAILKK